MKHDENGESIPETLWDKTKLWNRRKGYTVFTSQRVAAAAIVGVVAVLHAMGP